LGNYRPGIIALLSKNDTEGVISYTMTGAKWWPRGWRNFGGPTMARPATRMRMVANACQGGDGRTAYATGVLKVVVDSRIGRAFEVVGLSGTPDRALCTTLVWYGFWKGDQPSWRRVIDYWKDNTAQNWIELALNEAVMQSVPMVNRGLLPALQLP
jgi:predicted acylesterase/phospholipase RssA